MGMVMITLVTLVSPVFHDTLRMGKWPGPMPQLTDCFPRVPGAALYHCLGLAFKVSNPLAEELAPSSKDLEALRQRILRFLEKQGAAITRTPPIPPADMGILPKPVYKPRIWGGYEYAKEASRGTLFVYTWIDDTSLTGTLPWPTTVNLELSVVQDTLACYTVPQGEFCIHYFGHSHQEDPTNLQSKPVGAFETDSGNYTVLPVQTHPDGLSAVATLLYQAPEASGIVKVSASTGEYGLHAVGHSYVGIQLGSYASVAGGLVYLVGGTCKHYGNLSPWAPRNSPWWAPRCGLTDLNHELFAGIAPMYLEVMQQLIWALDWSFIVIEDSTSEPSIILQPSFMIPVNDVSLPFGGMFDICGTWNVNDRCALTRKGGHRTHRTGRTVDLSHKRKVPYLRPDSTVWTTSLEREKIKHQLRWLKRYKFPGCFDFLNEGDHYHLWFHPMGLEGRLDSMIVHIQEGRGCFAQPFWQP